MKQARVSAAAALLHPLANQLTRDIGVAETSASGLAIECVCPLELLAPIALKLGLLVGTENASRPQDRLLVVVVVVQSGRPIEMPPGPGPPAELGIKHHQHSAVAFPGRLRLRLVTKNREIGVHAQP